jgi:putative endonuclease
MKYYYVYILASERNGTIYIGMTDDLIRRVDEHRKEKVPGFTRTYHVHTLVYYEQGNPAGAAITREKQLKKWHRKWKLTLIEKQNPEWKDLWDDIIQ